MRIKPCQVIFYRSLVTKHKKRCRIVFRTSRGGASRLAASLAPPPASSSPGLEILPNEELQKPFTTCLNCTLHQILGQVVRQHRLAVMFARVTSGAARLASRLGLGGLAGVVGYTAYQTQVVRLFDCRSPVTVAERSVLQSDFGRPGSTTR